MPTDQLYFLIPLVVGLVASALVIVWLLAALRRSRRQTAAIKAECANTQVMIRGADESMLVIAAPSGRIIAANDALVPLTQLPMHSILGQRATDLLVRRELIPTTGDAETLASAWNTARDVEIARPDGKHVPVRARAIALSEDNSGESRVAVYLRDDVEMRSLNAAIAHEREFLKSMLEALPCGVIRMNDSGRIVELNDNARRFLGLASGELPESLLDDIASRVINEDGLSIGRHSIPLMRALTSGRHAGPSLIGLRVDGRIRWANVVSLPIYGPEKGTVNGVISFLMDVTGEREVAKAKEEAEEQSRRIFMANPQPMWIYDQSTLQFLEVNEAAVRNYGYSRQEFLSMTIEDIRPADDREALRNHLRTAPDTFASHGPWRHRRKNGTILLVEVTSHGLRYQNRPARFVLATDVTEREQTLAQLRENEERYRLVVEHTNHAVYDYDVLTGSIVWSGAAETVLGESIESLRGLHFDKWVERIHPDDRTATIDELDRCAMSGELFRVNYRMRRLDGSYVYVQDYGRFLRDESGLQYRMIGTLCNIADQMEAERKLKADEQRLRLATDAAGLGVWELDIASGNLSWTGRTREILGLDAGGDDAPLEMYLRYVHDADRAVAQEAIEASIAKGIDYFSRCRWNHPNGTLRWIESSGTVIHNDRGRADRMVGIVRDVTEQIENENRQRLLMDELDHRVKNNLAAVATIAEQTLASCGSLDEFRSSFTGRLVALARTHEALARAKWRGIDLHQAVELVLGAYLMSDPPRIRYQGERIQLPARAGMPVCLALHELATNAVKYGALSGPSGFVDLTWRLEEDGATVIVWHESGGPPVRSAGQSGMGRRLIEGLIVYELRGEVDLDFPESGVHCVIRLGPMLSMESSTDSLEQF